MILPSKRKVLCPNCGQSHDIDSRAIDVNRHFSIERNSRGALEYTMDIPTGWSIQEYRIPEYGIQGNLLASMLVSALVSSPAIMTANYLDLTHEQIAIISVSLFLALTGAALGWIQYSNNLRVTVGNWLNNQYVASSKPAVEEDRTIKLEVSETRQESQANSLAYRYIDGLDITAGQFGEWANEVTKPMGSLAYSNWTGSNKLFTRAEYDNLLIRLKDLGIAHKMKNRWSLTRGGKRALETAYSEEYCIG